MPTVSDRQNGKQFIPWLGLLIQEQSDFCLYCLPRPVCPIAEGHYTNILFGLAAPLFSETIYFHAYYILLIDAPGRGSIFGYHAILILIKALPFINKCPLSYFFTFFFFLRKMTKFHQNFSPLSQNYWMNGSCELFLLWGILVIFLHWPIYVFTILA